LRSALCHQLPRGKVSLMLLVVDSLELEMGTNSMLSCTLCDYWNGAPLAALLHQQLVRKLCAWLCRCRAAVAPSEPASAARKFLPRADARKPGAALPGWGGPRRGDCRATTVMCAVGGRLGHGRSTPLARHPGFIRQSELCMILMMTGTHFSWRLLTRKASLAVDQFLCWFIVWFISYWCWHVPTEWYGKIHSISSFFLVRNRYFFPYHCFKFKLIPVPFL
jgi:hypothetical protein